MSNSPVIAIVGPTAVGKSAFSVTVAEKVLHTQRVTGVDLISADSRQVYRGLEVLSGVDVLTTQLPITLQGTSFLNPDQEWSVAHFQKYAHELITEAEQANRLPLLVGGTGLYVQQLSTTDPKLHIGPNAEVRERAETMELSELQTWLKEVDHTKWEQMNDSDRANPRRLVRAIEIAVAKPVVSDDVTTAPIAVKAIGLDAPFEVIEENILKRVKDRFAHGAVAEVEHLMDFYPNQRLPAFSATGVMPMVSFMNGLIDAETCMQLWWRQERQYAKRQLTWWKKRDDVVWFDVTEENWQEKAWKVIESWL